MTPPVRLIAGAEIGIVRATWPCASSEIEPGRIRVSCLGTWELRPHDVLSVES